MSQPSYERARLELARLRIDSRETYDKAVVATTELSARTLGVERVGVWMFDAQDSSLLRLEHLYVASENKHSEGDVLLVGHAPRYREALLNRKAIVADDALTDSVTSALRDSYLAPQGISSMLDAPFYFRGEVVGVICHEHVGPPRHWTRAEIDFACTIADTASLLCEHAQHLRIERTLRERIARESAADGMETVRVLARSLSHELGNVFTATRLGTDQLARAADGSSSELATAIGEALSVGERLVADLRRFGDRVATPPSATRSPAREALARFSPILELLAHGQTLVVDAAPDVTLAMDDTSLEQVVLNLVLNARDAIAATGRTGTIRLTVEHADGHAVLAVTDDGPGIPAEVRAQLGREYFTTKPHGMGLGLSVARKLAEEANGRLELPSVERGTRVELRVPLVPV